MTTSLRSEYAALADAGKLERDPMQEAVVARLERLQAQLAEHGLARKSSALGWLFGRRERAEPPIRGLYIYGEVGRGKTMLMDLFFALSPVENKRRAHFHEFMSDVHERVHAWRQQHKAGEVKGEEPIAPVAAALAAEASLLCFDEFHVTDIADAMILGRLFTRLFEHGVVVVATSNVAPDDLYMGGLNRALFLPFVALLKQRMEVVRLDARTDFRLEKLAGVPVWHVPSDAAADAALDRAWRRLTAGANGTAATLTVKGRPLKVPHAAMGVARFSFHELCEQPLAAADYLRLAQDFHTIILDHVPVMGFANRNAAKRFIILIDTLYENAVKLIASAAAEPDGLYVADAGFEANEFKRTASRLVEMRSQAYLARPHGHAALAAGSVEGIVET